MSSAGFCRAQITPVVAKQRIVTDILDSEGNIVTHSETIGRYLRSSSGSTITQVYSSAGGKPLIQSGQLADYSRHKIYQLNYDRYEAVERSDLLDSPHPEYLANTSTAQGQETVNGLPCLIHGIYMTIDGKKQQIGKAYDSAVYGLHVKEDAIIEPPGGPRTHRVVELFDISFVEPDPREFALDKFSFPAKQPAACTKPAVSTSLESLK